MATGFETLWQTLEFARHSQLVIGGVFAAATSGATWWLTRQSYIKGDFRTRIEFVGVEPVLQKDGRIAFDFPSHGKQYDLHEIVGFPNMVREIVAATKSTTDGILRLKDDKRHRRMMGIFKSHVTGNDDRHNVEALDGVAGRRLPCVSFATYFYDQSEQVSMVRVFIASQYIMKLIGASDGAPRVYAAEHDDADVMEHVVSAARQYAQRDGDHLAFREFLLKSTYGGEQGARGLSIERMLPQQLAAE